MLDTKLTTINGVYHGRLFMDGRIIDEMSCQRKEDIGWMFREMMRWACKLGCQDPWAQAARKRQNEDSKVPDGIKYIGVK